MSLRRSVITTRVSETLSRPNIVRKRSWVSGRGGVTPCSGTAMPVASAGPMAMARRRWSRLPSSTTAGVSVRGSITTATTSASCGPSPFGGTSSARPGARSARPGAPATTSVTSAIATVRLVVLISASCPAISASVYVSTRWRAGQAGGDGAADREQYRERGPHDGVAGGVGHPAEEESAGGVADQEHRAEEADDGRAPLGRGVVGHQRGQSRVEKAVGTAGDETGQHQRGHHRRGAAARDEHAEGGQQQRAGGLHEH